MALPAAFHSAADVLALDAGELRTHVRVQPSASGVAPVPVSAAALGLADASWAEPGLPASRPRRP